MLFIYELLCLIKFSGNSIEIRNGADVFIRQLFVGFGMYSELVYGLFLLIVLLITMYFNRDTISDAKLTVSFLIYMLIESVFWSIGILIFMSISENLILTTIESNVVIEQFYLAIGAGIWEELLFRVGVISLILIFMTKIIGYTGLFSSLTALTISATLFSLFHYIGPFGDSFSYKTFYIRSLAGLFLGSLYLFRGFGITVYTHIFYDMIIISLPVLVTKT